MDRKVTLPTITKLTSILATVITLILVGCGGGAGGGSSPLTSTLGGVAAVGTPIAKGAIQISCAAGSALSTSTSSTGAWQVTLSGQTVPCAVQVSGGTINGIANSIPYHSIATALGTVNVTPLTDLMVANLAGTATPSTWFAGLNPATLAAINQNQVDTALTKLRVALNKISSLNTINPITTSFTPTAGNASDDILTALKVALANSNVAYIDLLNNASITAFTPPGSGFSTALTTAYSSTMSGGGSGTIHYIVGGVVSGLAGTVVLQDNGIDNLNILSNGNFTFATPVTNGDHYNVTVLTQPSGQICSVSTGAGTITGGVVSNVSVVCSNNSYTVSGNVTGLTGSVVLQNNGGNNTTITNNGTFVFAPPVANGSPYSVTVLSQPIGQHCTIASGTGTISTSNVTNVALTCSNSTYNYTVVDLGTLGGTLSQATSINIHGDVVGGSTTSGGANHAFLYTNGAMQDLGVLGAVSSLANSINDSGQVTGTFSGLSGLPTHAYIYTQGAMQDIGQWMVTSFGTAINNNGQIVGSSQSTTYGSPSQAFLYANSSQNILGTLGNGWSSSAMGINNLGQVTGSSNTAYGSNLSHAYLYSGSVMWDIGSLGGSSAGFSVNDSGQVTGSSNIDTITPYYHAFVYSNGVMQDIGTLKANSFSYSRGYSINNNGHVVGSADSNDTTFVQHAFIYSVSTGILDLNTLLPTNSGWVLTEARSINDKDQIVGTGVINGLTHAFLLTP